MRNVKGYIIDSFVNIPPYGANRRGDNTKPRDDMIAAKTLKIGEFIDVRDKERARAIAGNLRSTLGWNVQIRETKIYRGVDYS